MHKLRLQITPQYTYNAQAYAIEREREREREREKERESGRESFVSKLQLFSPRVLG